MSKIEIYCYLFLIVASYVIIYAIIILFVISFFIGDDGIFTFLAALSLVGILAFCLTFLRDLVDTLNNPRFDKSSLTPRTRKIFDWYRRKW